MPMKKPSGSPEWADPDDAPELTAALLQSAEVFEGEKFVRRAGRPKSNAPKEQVSLRLDRDVLATLRLRGPGWQSHVNTLLRQALGIGERDTAREGTQASASTRG